MGFFCQIQIQKKSHNPPKGSPQNSIFPLCDDDDRDLGFLRTTFFFVSIFSYNNSSTPLIDITRFSALRIVVSFTILKCIYYREDLALIRPIPCIIC